MAAAHASVLALETGTPRLEGRARELPSWGALADFISHCRLVMSEDDLIRELGRKSLPALKGERFIEPKLGPLQVWGLRSSAQINSELAVLARENHNRKAA